jgi:hypothetical protein
MAREIPGLPGPPPQDGGSRPALSRTILVGLPLPRPPGPRWSGPAQAVDGPRGATVLRTTLAALDAPLLARVLPDRVVAPLMGDGFDALEVAERLEALGYRGRLEVVCPALPDRRLIRAEIAAACPGVEVVFIGIVPGGEEG